jgi:hypothetical protein
VLAGPVLRRAQEDRVYVWLATSEPLESPRIDIHQVEQGRGGVRLRPLGNDSSATSLQLGARLWVHLLAAPGVTAPAPPSPRETRTAPGRPLPTDVLLGYDLVELGGRRRRLAELHGDLAALSLRGLPGPTFVLQGPRRPLRLAYASCRKLHGEGRDAAPALERLVDAAARDPRARVQTLLLGGDQVYADDVADLLIDDLTALGHAVLGRWESLPGVPEPHRLPIRGRDAAVKTARFSSGEAHNHLLTVGEWIAAYLLAWNPALWPTRFPSAVESLQRMDRSARDPVVGWILDGYPEQLRLLTDARAGSAAMRRVLANVATYMVFDDHEMTDDWNLNMSWERDVGGSALGRRLLLNGLCAYWAFQGWGNEPMDFPSNRVDPIVAYFARGADADADGAARALTTPRTWSFLVPTSPRTVVVDSRTGRGPTPVTVDSHQGNLRPRNPRAPRLLGTQERARTVELIRRARAEAGPGVVLLAPAPVWGLEGLEKLLSVAGFLAPAAVDLESWSANPRSRADLVTAALDSGVRPLVVLSGDVHYAFSAAVRVRGAGRDLPIAQFTSSATKNEAGGGLRWALRVLSVELPGLDSARSVWLQGGPDGPTHTVEVDPLAALPDRLAAEAVRRLLLATMGAPSWTETSAFAPVQRFGVGPLTVRDVVLRRNNVALLTVDGRTVTHRHLDADPSSSRAVPGVTWRLDDWPV